MKNLLKPIFENMFTISCACFIMILGLLFRHVPNIIDFILNGTENNEVSQLTSASMLFFSFLFYTFYFSYHEHKEGKSFFMLVTVICFSQMVSELSLF